MSFARLGFLFPLAAALPLAATLPLAALSFGCSDPVPPTPRGAWLVTFLDPGIECNIASHNAQVGEVNDREKSAVVTDGKDQAAVECTVQGDKTFSVDARASQSGKSLSLAIASIGPGATKEAPAKGNIAFRDDNTQDIFLSPQDNPCLFYFVPDTNEGVAKGKVWSAFECPVIESEGQSCTIKQGYMVFENCLDHDADEEEE